MKKTKQKFKGNNKKNNSKKASGKRGSSKKEIVEAKCIDIDAEGKGIVNYNGQEIRISNLIKDETAKIEIIKKGRHITGNLLKVLKPSPKRVKARCPHYDKCGGCQLQHMSYKDQFQHKQLMVEKLMKPFAKVNSIITMDNPYDYRNKAHATYSYKNGKIVSGFYEEKSHKVIPVDRCLIQSTKADDIHKTIRKLMKSFKMNPYDEDTGRGLIRHVLVKVGFATKEIMVILVTPSTMFASKNNFIKALRKEHPEIKTIIMNINNKRTSMVLGDREKVLYGKGTIQDTLCGYTFNISSKSFYQVNPKQTEKLYGKAIEMANFKGNEVVMDAYSGIGTIGIILSKNVKSVIGVELNKDAVRDSIKNAKQNQVNNARFYQGDAGEFMLKMKESGEKLDVVIMDPPRSGSDEKFLSSLVKISPKKVVYISCNPITQARDMKFLAKHGYKAEEIQPVDMFPQTAHVECVVLMSRVDK
ncbi:23S rRNA (uracil(1939)-C(5))-methyltransferase RlmD [Natranaerofaba carboxydovora]|uniref:23S rRNA (uracil(1939)-C(5))-methyltransferase RlmD n=1 Tax=Natranaerofaba carboxydovora TaxID=2742683 RepID=UPI001F13D95D|nr:23S rRNA (uracil(1939)-C(5))-methyltransferase RlmD [Natranaerofaba carboxydovora]UMZ74526.1 23S rRNA (uracil-C(5))-methyltransferase RlmCD [Natranaerofaba carboxydovora]